jgi:uncharacterized protein YqfA (UPF0365 family)
MLDLPGPLLIIISIVLFILAVMVTSYISLWFQAFVSGTPVSFFNIIGMGLRKIPARVIVNAYINAYKAGLKNVTVSDLETHFLAAGKVLEVISALIAADKANIALSWKQATAIDLAGRDILEAVRTSVNPKVIDCPDKGNYISAMSKDGVQLLCRARVTVRTDIQNLVGGATEETIIARVGEAIINFIGGTEHLVVLESPQEISRLALKKGLNTGTAFEILSIDIADINIGENIGARLRTEKAKADMQIAEAEAEKRRSMAVAAEQENIARVKEMEAKVVEAEAQIPMAMAEAFRNGNLGIMQYAQYENLRSDTSMREALAKDAGSNGCSGKGR